MMEQAAASFNEAWMDADDKVLASAVGNLLKTSGQATDGWADVAAEMGNGRTEQSCRSAPVALADSAPSAMRAQRSLPVCVPCGG